MEGVPSTPAGPCGKAVTLAGPATTDTKGDFGDGVSGSPACAAADVHRGASQPPGVQAVFMWPEGGNLAGEMASLFEMIEQKKKMLLTRDRPKEEHHAAACDGSATAQLWGDDGVVVGSQHPCDAGGNGDWWSKPEAKRQRA